MSLLRDKVRSCEIRKDLNVDPLIRVGRFQPQWFGHVTRKSQDRLSRQVLLAYTQGRGNGPDVCQGPGGLISD